VAVPDALFVFTDALVIIDNLRAQAVYERVGAKRSEWLDYSLDAGAASPGATSPDS